MNLHPQAVEPATIFPGRVLPRSFSREEDDRPYERPQTPAEVADWLDAFGYALAPATEAVQRRFPGSAWVAWRDEFVQFVDASVESTWGLVALPEVAVLERQWGRAVVAFVAKQRFVERLSEALAEASSAVLDATRDRLGSPASPAPVSVPDVLRREDPRTLANVWDHPPGDLVALSPKQWREGAQLWRRANAGHQWCLTRTALDLLAAEEGRRLSRLPSARGCHTRERL